MKTMIELPKAIKTPSGVVYDVDDIRRFMREWGQLKIIAWDTWFNGQTGLIWQGKYCVYDYDFDRFCNMHGLSIGGVNK